MTIPVSIQPLLTAYLQKLEPLRSHFYGIYIYGSIVLEAFEEGRSDIDILAVTQGTWTESELTQLKVLHGELVHEYPLAQRLDVLYVPLEIVNGQNEVATSYPVMRDGRFIQAGQSDLNAVTRWLVKNKGICLWGAERSMLPLSVTWEDVLATMHYNLESYWASKASKPYLFLADFWVEFAVSTLCRILTTVEEGKIISKSAALQCWREHLPSEWHLLIDEAWRIRHQPLQRSLYRSRLKRMRETLAFIRYVRGRADKTLSAAS